MFGNLSFRGLALKRPQNATIRACAPLLLSTDCRLGSLSAGPADHRWRPLVDVRSNSLQVVVLHTISPPVQAQSCPPPDARRTVRESSRLLDRPHCCHSYSCLSDLKRPSRCAAGNTTPRRGGAHLLTWSLHLLVCSSFFPSRHVGTGSESTLPSMKPAGII